jgi:DNA polymerase III delta prime subunit
MKLDKDNLHHAHLFEGERRTLLAELFDFVDKKLKIERKGNPNFYFSEFDTFTIDDGRMLKEMQGNKAQAGEKQLFVLAFNSITREAQNSLLKIFEEPAADIHFFILIPSSHILLPTLLSRLAFAERGKAALIETREAEKFLKLSKADRILFIKELMEDIGDEKKTKQDAINLLQQIETALSSKISLSKASADEISTLNAVVKAQDFASDKSASVKMILEHIALTV